MKRIRLPVSGLIVWLFAFYNIERLSSFINLSQVAYVLVPVAAVALLLSPQLRKINLWIYAALATGVFLSCELWLGYGLADIPILLTEVFILLVTIVLARMVSDGVTEFELSVINITLGQLGERRSRQGEMYREVKRARVHQRPLAVMAVRADDSSVEMSLDRMVREAQQAMVRQYVLASVSKALYDELEEYNIIAKRNDHFLVLLPETAPEKLPELIKRVRRAVTDRVGVSVHIGTATLSKDLTTFDALVDKASEEIRVERGQLFPWNAAGPIGLAADTQPLTESPNGRADH
jgi:GGDEF domain-containing protein